MRIRPVGYRTVAALVALGTVLLGIKCPPSCSSSPPS
jgi:hypothetical protein